MNFRPFLALVVAVALAGCASTPAPVPPLDGLFMDAAFKPPSVPVVPGDAIAMSPEMRRFADKQIYSEIYMRGHREGLLSALYSKGLLQLEYDTARTRSAAEAFEARRGNCMSLVLMTAAFAKYYRLPTIYNSVYLDEVWTRTGGMYFVAGHVNITLGRTVAASDLFWSTGENLMTIDFLPPRLMRGQRSRVVDESTIIAMYLNNRAAESMTEDDVNDAYWWVRAAIQTDPRWLAAYNTLAVVYRRVGQAAQAEFALRLVLEREPMNAQALSNMTLVLNDAGRTAEARVYAARLAQIQPVPPYALFDEGVAAMKAGDYAKARELFRKEIARDSYVAEFHFWLALANYSLGDLGNAKGEIAKALDNSTAVRDRELYGAKLAWLNQQRRGAELQRR